MIGSCKVKETNQSTAVASEPMAMQPTIARQNGRDVWLYNPLLATASQISSKEATERAAHSTARNAVLVPISQGTEVTIVTEYVPLWYFTRTASRYRCKYGNQSNHAVLWRGMTRNQDLRGIRPSGVNRIHQAQGEPWGSSVAWVSSRRDTWHPYSYGQNKLRGAWTKLVKWTRNIAT